MAWGMGTRRSGSIARYRIAHRSKRDARRHIAIRRHQPSFDGRRRPEFAQFQHRSRRRGQDRRYLVAIDERRHHRYDAQGARYVLRDTAPVPRTRRRLAILPVATWARMLPRRRHGLGQDDTAHLPHSTHEKAIALGSSRHIAHLPDERRRELEARICSLCAR